MTTAAKSATVFTVTRRSRNLGIGWSNTPARERSGNFSRLVIADVTKPDVVGTPEDVARELERARRINSGNDWARAYFVGGVKVDREGFEHAMEMLRTPYPRERGERTTRKYLSDSETVYAVGSPELAALNTSISRGMDEECGVSA